VTLANMKALLFPILKELTVWTEGNRTASARLLRTCLVYSEAKITRHVHRIMPMLVKVIADPVVAAPLAQCCIILARFVEPEYLMASLLPAITVEESNEACTNAVRSRLGSTVEEKAQLEFRRPCRCLSASLPGPSPDVSRPDVSRDEHTSFPLLLL
jgi:hypothetical protein